VRSSRAYRDVLNPSAASLRHRPAGAIDAAAAERNTKDVFSLLSSGNTVSVIDATHETAHEHGPRHTCAVCGCAVDLDDVEDTNGWRWFSDGRGALLALCPTCPVPTLSHESQQASSPPRGAR